jgi:uncharacterized membrane protein
MFRYGPGGLHHSPGVFGWLLLALLLALLVLGVVALVRFLARPGSRMSGAGPVGTPAAPIDPAFAELRMRYARGEVSWEEFAERARNLGYPLALGGPPPATPPSTPPAAGPGS